MENFAFKRQEIMKEEQAHNWKLFQWGIRNTNLEFRRKSWLKLETVQIV